MAERLHYFNDPSTPVAFDLEESDVDSAEEALRRPTTEVERNKHHTIQLQVWSDEVRRRRTVLPPQRRPSTSSIHDSPMVATNNAFFPVALDDRTFRASMDRQPSNLSDRSRNPASLRLSRSSSGKKLRIQITPSSSTKSMSDIDSDHSSTMPNSPLKPHLNLSTMTVSRKLDDSLGSRNAERFRKCASAADLRSRAARTSMSQLGSVAVNDSKRAHSAMQARGYTPGSRADSEFVGMASTTPIPATSHARSTHRTSRRTARPSLFRSSISRLKRFLLNR